MFQTIFLLTRKRSEINSTEIERYVLVKSDMTEQH